LYSILTVVVVVAGCWGGDRFLSHHELRPSVGPVLNRVCVCLCIGTRPRCSHMHVHMRCEQSLSSLF